MVFPNKFSKRVDLLRGAVYWAPGTFLSVLIYRIQKEAGVTAIDGFCDSQSNVCDQFAEANSGHSMREVFENAAEGFTIFASIMAAGMACCAFALPMGLLNKDTRSFKDVALSDLKGIAFTTVFYFVMTGLGVLSNPGITTNDLCSSDPELAQGCGAFPNVTATETKDFISFVEEDLVATIWLNGLYVLLVATAAIGLTHTVTAGVKWAGLFCTAERGADTNALMDPITTAQAQDHAHAGALTSA